MTYKVLDVREVSKCTTGRVNSEIYGHGGTLSIEETSYIVVIAENEEHHRTRFQFYPGYQTSFLGEPHYYGYRGDFDILIAGDSFQVQDTDTWPNVKLI